MNPTWRIDPQLNAVTPPLTSTLTPPLTSDHTPLTLGSTPTLETSIATSPTLLDATSFPPLSDNTINKKQQDKFDDLIYKRLLNYPSTSTTTSSFSNPLVHNDRDLPFSTPLNPSNRLAEVTWEQTMIRLAQTTTNPETGMPPRLSPNLPDPKPSSGESLSPQATTPSVQSPVQTLPSIHIIEIPPPPFNQTLPPYTPLMFTERTWNESDFLSLMIQKWLPYSTPSGRKSMLQLFTRIRLLTLLGKPEINVQLLKELASEHYISFTSMKPYDTLITTTGIRNIREAIVEEETRIRGILLSNHELTGSTHTLVKTLNLANLVFWFKTLTQSQERRLTILVENHERNPLTVDKDAVLNAVDWAISRRNARIVVASIVRRGTRDTCPLAVIKTLKDTDASWVNLYFREEAKVKEPEDLHHRTIDDLIPAIRILIPLSELSPLTASELRPTLPRPSSQTTSSSPSRVLNLSPILNQETSSHSISIPTILLLLALGADHRYHKHDAITNTCQIDIVKIGMDILRPEIRNVALALCSAMPTSSTSNLTTTTQAQNTTCPPDPPASPATHVYRK